MKPKKMTDIALTDRPKAEGALTQVGMSDIEMPVMITLGEWDHPVLVCAYFDAYVNLHQRDAKGIHMSRLYLGLKKYFESQSFSYENISAVLDDFIESHSNLSDHASIHVRFELPMIRSALKSDNKGWRYYPLDIFAEKKLGKQVEIRFDFDLSYSSTCPCSASLARELIAENFSKVHKGKQQISMQEVQDFLLSERGILATPHSQRSVAKISITPKAGMFSIEYIQSLINQSEAMIKTTVQAAVKREDEQAFALLNGENLMFSEDAARVISEGLNKVESVIDFKVRVEHFESLHPHNAVAAATKSSF